MHKTTDSQDLKVKKGRQVSWNYYTIVNKFRKKLAS